MPTYKLIYFNAKSRGELIRYMFAESGANYDDFRFEIEEWPGSYKSDTPFGQVPVLEVDGKKMAQTCAIVRYLAREFDLEPETSFEKLYADMTLEALAEMFDRYTRMTVKERDEKLSYIDIALMNFALRVKEYYPTFIDDFPKLKELVEGVTKRPNIAAWLNYRPVTKY